MLDVHRQRGKWPDDFILRVVDLRHSSPATVKLEPVLGSRFRRLELRVDLEIPETRSSRFFDSLEAIRFRGEVIENTTEETVYAFFELITGLGKAFTLVLFSITMPKFLWTLACPENLDNLVKPGCI